MTTVSRIILAYLLLVPSLYAHDLTTPKGTAVTHSHPSDSPWSDPVWDPPQTPSYWSDWADQYWSGIYIEKLDRANQAYNCHSYAWAGSRQSNSDSWCWISTEEDVYWTDGSYIAADSPPTGLRGTHVSYRGLEHSLLTYSAALNTVTSKWGKYPVYKHYLYSDPYGSGPNSTSFKKYYITTVPGTFSNLNTAFAQVSTGETFDVSDSQTLSSSYDLLFRSASIVIRSTDLPPINRSNSYIGIGSKEGSHERQEVHGRTDRREAAGSGSVPGERDGSG
jgi:hypothetical protein